MYNTVLGAKPLQQDGRSFYYSDYGPGAQKTYFAGNVGSSASQWPCCSGTLPQVAADYRICTYFEDTEGVYVNLYIPSTLRWRQSGADVSLTQTGQYPLNDLVTFEIDTTRPADFALRLRIPAWATNPSVHVNGRSIASPVQSGTFATVKREWRSGDRIELELPHLLELKSIDAQHPNTVALAHGPLVLFALAADTPQATRQQLLAAKRRSDESEEWTAETANGRLRFLPWWVIRDERYATYLSVV